MVFATDSDVTACYRLFLGREPDPAGMRAFLELIKGGRFPTEELAELFMNSPEAVQLRAKRTHSANNLESLELDAFKITIAPEWNNIHKEIARTRRYEPYISEHFVNLIDGDTVFVDIGANIGYYSLLAASKGASIHAFEPNPRNLWLLDKNARDNAFQIQIWPYAVADSERLVLYNPLDGNGQISELTAELPTDAQEVLRTVTLDRTLDSVHVDIIKIDVEGAEGLAFAGANRILDQRPIIISEFSASTLPAISHMTGAQYLEYFVSRDYRFTLCQRNGKLIDIDATELEQASLESAHNSVDFIAFPNP